jgi:outer membrane protein TolC
VGKSAFARCAALLLTSIISACADDPAAPELDRPNVAPVRQKSSGTLRLDNEQIPAMYRQVLAIDLENVAHVASADNIDILKARQQVEASQGQLESAGAAILPVVGPGIVLNHLQGVDINNLGILQAAHFTTLNPAVLVRWAVNPGQVYFNVLASKKRLLATKQQDSAVKMQIIKVAVLQYYDLVLAQARVAVARDALAQAQEFVRLAQRRYDAQSGLFVDVTRGDAVLADRQQDLALALNDFHKASVALGSTLDLDPTVTLVPRARELARRDLVRGDLGIDQMLALAVQWRPDLQSVNTLLAAADDDTKAIIWGAGTPNLQATYQAGKFGSRTATQVFPSRGQEISGASVGWVFNPVVFGQVRTSGAVTQIAVLDAKRLLEEVKAEVVVSAQDSITFARLIPIAEKQVAATQDALRVTRENFQIGTGLFLDVLQAEDALSQARLRHASAITNYNRSQVSLLAALGLLDQTNVAAASTPKFVTK